MKQRVIRVVRGRVAVVLIEGAWPSGEPRQMVDINGPIEALIIARSSAIL